MFTLFDITSIAIRLERNGESVYRRAAGMASEAAVHDLFIWLADQEAVHRQWFRALQQRNAVPGRDQLLDEASAEALTAMLGTQSFFLEDPGFPQDVTLEDLRLSAMEFERDTILFYELIHELIQRPDTGSILDVIISEEHRHVKALEELSLTQQQGI